MSVQSVNRAFTLLRAIAEHHDGISVTDLARYTQLHKSTVSRLVMALEREQAIERDDGLLVIGEGIAHLVASSLAPSSLKTLVRPYLHQLADLTRETVGLCIQEDDAALYIDQVSTEQDIQIRDWTGERLPLNAVSSGKLFLAFSSGEAVAEYLSRTPLERQTPNTIVNRQKLLHRLDQVRVQGYDWSEEEFTEGLNAVSGPIFDRNDHLVASIYVCGPSFRFPPSGQRDQIARNVVQTCQEISERISFRKQETHVY